MRLFLLSAVSLIGFTGHAFAQSDASAANDPAGTVVVTAQPLTSTEAALKACIARKCPPAEDIAATLAHAENQFVAGAYKAARGTLLDGRARNLRYGRQLPEPVANLLRANARIGAHLGEGEVFQLDTIIAFETLRRALPAEDPRVLEAQIEQGDMFLRFGRIVPAAEAYRAVERRARAVGNSRMLGFALLRQLQMYSAISEDSSISGLTGAVGYEGDAERAYRALTDGQNPALAEFGDAARIVRAQSKARSGDTKSIDTLANEYRNRPPSDHPVLLYSPAIAVNAPGMRALPVGNQFDEGNVLNRTTTEATFSDQWVDIGFTILPDGTVSDVGVLRESRSFIPGWEKPVIEAYSKRRYAPNYKGGSGRMRVERVTFTARYASLTGSRIRTRDVVPQIEILDLTNDVDAKANPAG